LNSNIFFLQTDWTERSS